MAYEDMFSVLGAAPAEEEDLSVGLTGMDALNAELFRVGKQLADARSKNDTLRQQQLERATQMLQQRQYGPTLSERLLQMSAAFAQPSRTRGLAGVLGNVMPVLAQQMAVGRLGSAQKAEDLLDLEQRTEKQRMDAEERGYDNQLALLKARMQAMPKPQLPQYMMHPTDGPIAIDRASGTARRVPYTGGGAGAGGPSEAHVAALRANPDRAAEFDAKFGAGAAARILGTGGPTGSAPSGGFRNVPSGNPLIRP